MGTLNSGVKKLDGLQETIQCGTPEALSCVQVGPKELVEKHTHICTHTLWEYYLHEESLNKRLHFPFHLSF